MKERCPDCGRYREKKLLTETLSAVLKRARSAGEAAELLGVTKESLRRYALRHGLAALYGECAARGLKRRGERRLERSVLSLSSVELDNLERENARQV